MMIYTNFLWFGSQRALYNVLKAYAIYDPEVGYCQGMSAIVALLLLYFGEEESFWILVKLLQDFQMREYYKPGMVGLTKSFKILEELVLKKSPSVYQKLVRSFPKKEKPSINNSSSE